MKELFLRDTTNVLVIDDLRIFDDFPDAVYARTRVDGSTWLRTQPWDIVFLDHDLGEQGKDGPHDFGDIRPLIHSIVICAEENVLFPVKQFYVCSDNPPGRDWIIAMLEPYYPIEYFQPKFHILGE